MWTLTCTCTYSGNRHQNKYLKDAKMTTAHHTKACHRLCIYFSVFFHSSILFLHALPAGHEQSTIITLCVHHSVLSLPSLSLWQSVSLLAHDQTLLKHLYLIDCGISYICIVHIVQCASYVPRKRLFTSAKTNKTPNGLPDSLCSNIPVVFVCVCVYVLPWHRRTSVDWTVSRWSKQRRRIMTSRMTPLQPGIYYTPKPMQRLEFMLALVCV